MAILSKNTIGREVKDGVLAAWPICLGYIPIGLAFGVLAQKAGLHPVQVGMMSVLVFAGSSQFIAVSMVAAGASPLAIVMTTFAVNLRHFLMSSSLSMFLGKTSKKLLSLYAYGVTDESFAVNLFRFRQGGWDVKRALIVNHVANLAWVTSTILGGYGGNLIPERAFGIDYALNAMFICLLVFQWRGKKYVVTSAVSGVLAVFLALLIPGNSYIVLASILAATLVVLTGKAGVLN
ncbi:MAG: AzlC family ABC transporter permease [Thermodesulfobacteriota bacterium]